MLVSYVLALLMLGRALLDPGRHTVPLGFGTMAELLHNPAHLIHP